MSFFPDIPKIQFEGPKSKNPFAFKQYNPDEIVAGKSMKDHCRFAAAYWHVMRNGLSDPFGGPTALMPWDVILWFKPIRPFTGKSDAGAGFIPVFSFLRV